MNSYFVFTIDLSHVAQGSFAECQTLADQLTLDGQFPLLKIARCRAGEPDATVIFDVDKECRRQSGHGRRVPRQVLQKGAKQRPFPT